MAEIIDTGIHYQIMIKGRLDESWAEWFEEMEISHDEQGNTILGGEITDQAELQGILSRIGMLNMTLLSVSQIDLSLQEEPIEVVDSEPEASSDVDNEME